MNITGYKKKLANIKDTLKNELLKDKDKQCFDKVRRLEQARKNCSAKIKLLKIENEKKKRKLNK